MKHILPINEGWAFVKGCETAPAAIPAGAARVDLPHCWNALDGQDGGSGQGQEDDQAQHAHPITA